MSSPQTSPSVTFYVVAWPCTRVCADRNPPIFKYMFIVFVSLVNKWCNSGVLISLVHGLDLSEGCPFLDKVLPLPRSRPAIKVLRDNACTYLWNQACMRTCMHLHALMCRCVCMHKFVCRWTLRVCMCVCVCVADVHMHGQVCVCVCVCGMGCYVHPSGHVYEVCICVGIWPWTCCIMCIVVCVCM